MSFHRIWGVVLRHLYLFRRSYDRLSETFYWPIVDLVLWGVTSTYVYKISPTAGNIVFALVAAVIFWNFVIRGQGDISTGILEDLWNRNFINLFVSPLKIGEMLIALILVSIIKALISFVFASSVAFVLYQVNILSLGWHLVWFAVLLMMFGWCLGMVVVGAIMRYGTKIQTLAWTLIWIFSPFSAVFFPVTALPNWAQAISHALPSTYVFESMRSLANTGRFDLMNLVIGYSIAFVYLFLGFLFVKSSYKKALSVGLIKLN